MWKYGFAFSLFVLLSVFSPVNRADAATQPKRGIPPAPVSIWTDDWNTALAKAKKERKPVFVDFYTDWCVWCKRLDKDTYSDSGVQKQMREGWVSVKLNAEDDSRRGTYDGRTMTYPQLTRYFQISGYPALLFIDKTGKPVGIIPGYLPPKIFSRALDYYKSEMYAKKIDLETYLSGGK